MDSLSPDALRLRMAIMLDKEVEKVQRAGQGMAKPEFKVDNVTNKHPFAMRAGGTQAAEDTAVLSIGKVIADVWTLLLRHSPYSPKSPADLRGAGAFRKRHYAEMHQMLVNGRSLSDAEIQAYEPQIDDRISFLNPQPYARRIDMSYLTDSAFGPSSERSKRRKRKRKRKVRIMWSEQAPRGVYRMIEGRIRAKYGRVVDIQFYEALAPGFPGIPVGLRVPILSVTAKKGDVRLGRRGFSNRATGFSSRF